MTVHASCHCGGTRIEIAMAPTGITVCNCTFCYKRGGLWVYYEPDQVVIRDTNSVAYTSDPDLYTHYHCGTCGCSTHSRCAGTWTDEGLDTSRPRVTVNARLLDDFEIDALPVVRLDGRNEW